MTAVLGHLAQLVARGLNSVGGGGTSRASGGGTTQRPVGGKPWERREPVWALSHVATVWGRRARGHGRGSRPGWITGKEGLQRPVPPAGRLRAHRVGDLRGLSRPRSEVAPIVDARWWPIRAPSCPGVQVDDHRIQGARVGAVPLRCPPRCQASPPGPMGATGPGGPTCGSTVLAALPLPRVGTCRRSRLAPVAIPDDRSAQRPARVPGAILRAKRAAGHQSQWSPAPPESFRSNKPSNVPQERNCSTTPTPANTNHHINSHHASILPNQRGHTDN